MQRETVGFRAALPGKLDESGALHPHFPRNSTPRLLPRPILPFTEVA
jgi:hypothetical protein